MSKWIVYLLGIVTGFMLSAIYDLRADSEEKSESEFITEETEQDTNAKITDGEVRYSENPIAFTAANKFKVSRVLDNGVIAESRKNGYSSDYFSDPRIYIPADGQNMYYDDQIITIPPGKKAVQVGTIKIYSSVYPIIEFR